MSRHTISVDTVIVGGGQAGLTAGYMLRTRQPNRSFVILDAHARVGDAWRTRWDSLRLFTPAHLDALPGLKFPLPAHQAPTKDQMADYLEAYAQTFSLPVRNGSKVERISRKGEGFVVTAPDVEIHAGNVIVACGAFHTPKVPVFAKDLDPDIVQIHSTAYKNPSQLREGGVLLVGAGNSGADIALDVVGRHPTWLAGRSTGHVPFRIDSFKARFLVRVVRFMGHHVFTRRSPIGRKIGWKLVSRGTPLVRVKPKDLAAAGVERTPRVAGVRDGLPLLEDGRVLDVANVIWCTGYRSDFSWIDVDARGEDGLPEHTRGVVQSIPGLYFMTLPFQFSVTSDVITGAKRDARYVVKHLAKTRASRVEGVHPFETVGQ